MADIMDYIAWRGDVPFAVSPFNEADNYIIAKIGTADFTGIVSKTVKSMLIGDAVDDYFEKSSEKGRLGLLASAQIPKMLKLLPDTRRFGSLRLSQFVKTVTPDEQFSALTVRLPDGTKCVTFRGTDDTIVGWKENFLMSLGTAVNAQKDAAAYLEKVASRTGGRIMVLGHSKGGNLAVYAAAKASPEVQERILAVYNNDGPGFTPEFLQSEGYQRIREKVHTLLPEGSIIGTLLCQEAQHTIVACPKSGVASHDGFNWSTDRCGLLHAKELTKASRVFDAALDDKLNSMSLDERKEFIETLFDILTADGDTTLTELTEHKLKKAIGIAKSLRKEKGITKFAFEMAELILKEYKKN